MEYDSKHLKKEYTNSNGAVTASKVHSTSKPKWKRKVTFGKSTENIDSLIITQKVRVKKRNIECTINFKNICQIDRKTNKSNISRSSEDRIVPHCLRKFCEQAIESKISRRQKKVDVKKYPKDAKVFKKHKRAYVSTSEKSIEIPKTKRSKSEEKEISYEDISSDSLSEHSSNSGGSDKLYVDEKLDTLIKRSKARERKMSRATEKDYSKPLYTSTPLREPADDLEDIISPSLNMDASMDSQATFILEPKSELVSPRNLEEYTLGYYEQNSGNSMTFSTSNVCQDFLNMNTPEKLVISVDPILASSRWDSEVNDILKCGDNHINNNFSQSHTITKESPISRELNHSEVKTNYSNDASQEVLGICVLPLKNREQVSTRLCSRNENISLYVYPTLISEAHTKNENSEDAKADSGIDVELDSIHDKSPIIFNDSAIDSRKPISDINTDSNNRVNKLNLDQNYPIFRCKCHKSMECSDQISSSLESEKMFNESVLDQKNEQFSEIGHQHNSEISFKPDQQRNSKHTSDPGHQHNSELSPETGSQENSELSSQPSQQLNSAQTSDAGPQQNTEVRYEPSPQPNSKLSSEPGSQQNSELYSEPSEQLYFAQTSDASPQLDSEISSEPSLQQNSQLPSEPGSQQNSELYSEPSQQRNSAQTSDACSQLDSEISSEPSLHQTSELSSELDSQQNSELSSETGSQENSELASEPSQQLNSAQTSDACSQLESEISSEPSLHQSSELSSELDSQQNWELSSETGSQENSELTSESNQQQNSAQTSDPGPEQNFELPSEPSPQPNSKLPSEPSLQQNSKLSFEPGSQQNSEICSEPSQLLYFAKTSDASPQLDSEISSEPSLQQDTQLSSEPGSQQNSELYSEPSHKRNSAQTSCFNACSQLDYEISSEPSLQQNSELSFELVSQQNSELSSETGSQDNSEPSEQLNSAQTSDAGPQQNAELPSEPSPQLNSKLPPEPSLQQNSELSFELGSQQNTELYSEPSQQQNSAHTSDACSQLDSEISSEPSLQQYSELSCETGHQHNELSTEPDSQQNYKKTSEPSPQRSSEISSEPGSQQNSEISFKPDQRHNSKHTSDPGPQQNSELSSEPSHQQNSEQTSKSAHQHIFEQPTQPGHPEKSESGHQQDSKQTSEPTYDNSDIFEMDVYQLALDINDSHNYHMANNKESKAKLEIKSEKPNFKNLPIPILQTTTSRDINLQDKKTNCKSDDERTLIPVDPTPSYQYPSTNYMLGKRAYVEIPPPADYTSNMNVSEQELVRDRNYAYRPYRNIQRLNRVQRMYKIINRVQTNTPPANKYKIINHTARQTTKRPAQVKIEPNVSHSSENLPGTVKVKLEPIKHEIVDHNYSYFTKMDDNRIKKRKIYSPDTKPFVANMNDDFKIRFTKKEPLD